MVAIDKMACGLFNTKNKFIPRLFRPLDDDQALFRGNHALYLLKEGSF